MVELLEQLEPIAAIVGPSGVKASFSDYQIYVPSAGRHSPGWEVEVSGTYKGAQIHLKEESPSLDEAATAALRRLKEALGLP